MELTQEQIEAVRQGQPVRVPSAEVGEDVVLLRASRFKELQELLDDEQEKRGWAAAASAAAIRWAQENPY